MSAASVVEVLAAIRIHGTDLVEHVAMHYPDAVALLGNGWTVDSALAHVDGTCDRALCTGEHDN